LAQYIIRRLWTAIPVLLLITFITFVMIDLAPGDPLDYMVDAGGGGIQNREAMREALGLNKPVVVRYVIWLRQLAGGHLGYSGMTSMPVERVLGPRLAPTLLLMVTAMVFSIGIGVPMGVISALRQYSVLDHIITLFAFTWISIPGFFAAMGALYIFSLKFPLFPPFGMRTPTGAQNEILDIGWHLVLPALVLGLEHLATYVRYSRASMLEVLHQDYVTTARGKGLPERTVILRHALRTALLPLLTVIGLQLPSLFGGAVLIESIFAWPGMGSIAVQAATTRDYSTIMAFNLITASLVMAANLLTDISYAIADPRIRYS
jgi:peptide/nickel transport system permease protein